MANWDFVFAYTDEAAACLRQQGHPHPAVRPGNQLPTTAEMKWALEADEGLSFHYPPGDGEVYGPHEAGGRFVISGFDWDQNRTVPGDSFAIRGSRRVTLSILIRLCERCGQLYLYPDTGDPAIVLDASLDASAIAELHAEACERADGWAYFFERMYGPGGLANPEPG